MSPLALVRDLAVGGRRAVERAYALIFTPLGLTPLILLRVLLGASLVVEYLRLMPDVVALYSDNGLSSKAAMIDRRGEHLPSVFAYVREALTVQVMHCVFMALALMFALGLKIRWIRWPLWFLHYSYIIRNPLVVYGVDNVMNSFLFLLALTPHTVLTRRWSLDAYLARNKTLPARGLEAVRREDAWASGILRLIRWQLMIIYLFAGCSKLKGESWWSGDAIWHSLLDPEFRWSWGPVFFSHHYWIVNIVTYGSVLLELSYPFLVWFRSVRLYLVTLTIAMHLGIALLMNLWYFGAVMIAGNLAFLDEATLNELGDRLRTAAESRFGRRRRAVTPASPSSPPP